MVAGGGLMSRLMFRLEDHFYAMAEQRTGCLASALWRRISNFFAFAGDVLNATALRPRFFLEDPAAPCDTHSV